MACAGMRKTCLMVLSHLILNDMMKVKGHIARLALCLQDDNQRISGLAHVFFHELSRKAFKVGSSLLQVLVFLGSAHGRPVWCRCSCCIPFMTWPCTSLTGAMQSGTQEFVFALAGNESHLQPAARHLLEPERRG